MNAYLDLGSGVAGDMLLGALHELGLSIAEVQAVLRRVSRRSDFKLEVIHVERQHWPAHAFRVVGDRPFGNATAMKSAVRKASLPRPVKQRSLRILERLEWAEHRAHRHAGEAFSPEGLGMLDTLVDVVGNAYGVWKLGFSTIRASHLNTGRLAPATLQLIKRFGIPVYADAGQAELATPTGVAILSDIVESFGPLPLVSVRSAGYGAGGRDHHWPNVLSILTEEGHSSRRTWQMEPVLLLETVMDDMDPRLYPHVTDLLFKAGARDVWWAPIGMKKGRPGVGFSVLADPNDEQGMLRILFAETTTLGIRRQVLNRWVLPRREEGPKKWATLPGGVLRARGEYEVVRRQALTRSQPLRKLLK